MHIPSVGRDRPRFGALSIVFSLIPTIACADLLTAHLGPNFVDGSVVRRDDLTGEKLSGGVASGTAQIGLPSGVAIGADGNIYVASSNFLSGAGEILFFDGATGAPLPSPHDGARDGLFATLPFNPPPSGESDPVAPSPGRLKFGPDGNLYVADMAGGVVRAFDSTTGLGLPDAATDLAGPTGLAFGPDGAMYVGNFNSASVDRVVDGVKETFIQFGSSPLATASSFLFLPSGELIVVDLFGSQLLKYDGDGNYLPSFDEQNNPVPFAVIPPEIPMPLPDGVTIPSNNPSDIVLDGDGNLVVSVLGLTNPPDNRGALLRYDLAGNLLETIVEGELPVAALTWIASRDAIAGDYDGNGTVDLADYDKWRSNFGKLVAPGGGADGNGNGLVDAADYTLWRDALGNGAEVAQGAGAVPEPATGLLALLAVALGFAVLGRRGR